MFSPFSSWMNMRVVAFMMTRAPPYQTSKTNKNKQGRNRDFSNKQLSNPGWGDAVGIGREAAQVGKSGSDTYL